MTKRMAGMQPYFFPYLGYWQLIDAVDYFVLFDEAQYIKQGWVNRNRALKREGGWQYIGVPVSKHPLRTPISAVRIAPGIDWQHVLLTKLAHYETVAPYFAEVMELVQNCLSGNVPGSIGELNARVIRRVCKALSIRSEIIVSSEYGFDYTDVSEPGDWALAHATQLGATEIVNPIGGIALQNRRKLATNGIGLSALLPTMVTYSQSRAPFEPNMSIIDVMMFNGFEGAAQLLTRRSVVAQQTERIVQDD